MKMRTVIADDDTVAVQGLLRLLARFNEEIDVIGIARTGKEGLQMIDQLRPQLTFVDLEMPLLDGFEIARRLTHKPLIVFMTASADRRRETEAVGALSLL